MSDSKGPCQPFITSRLDIDISKLNKKRNGWTEAVQHSYEPLNYGLTEKAKADMSSKKNQLCICNQYTRM